MNIVTLGIGPGSAIKYLLTSGLDLSSLNTVFITGGSILGSGAASTIGGGGGVSSIAGSGGAGSSVMSSGGSNRIH